MQLDLYSGVVPAVIVIALVIGLEDWALYQARTKLQRALIMGGAVFVLVIIFNLPWNSL